ncbi:12999_t:CDS:2, partial [Entrophospora sp. SA101]
MKGLFDDPDKHIVQWPNTALNESKARRFEGQIKQPDFAVSIICQLQTNATIFEKEKLKEKELDKLDVTNINEKLNNENDGWDNTGKHANDLVDDGDEAELDKLD